MDHRQDFGRGGEAAVAAYLEKMGFIIITRNFRSRSGEVDLIAQRDEVIAFVEVKTRLKKYFHSSLVITQKKQRSIITTALFFVQRNRISNRVLRFDVALVEMVNGNYAIDYIPNAFQAT